MATSTFEAQPLDEAFGSACQELRRERARTETECENLAGAPSVVTGVLSLTVFETGTRWIGAAPNHVQTSTAGNGPAPASRRRRSFTDARESSIAAYRCSSTSIPQISRSTVFGRRSIYNQCRFESEATARIATAPTALTGDIYWHTSPRTLAFSTGNRRTSNGTTVLHTAIYSS